MTYLHKNKNILFIDLEMSGTFEKKSKGAEIIEIAMVLATNFQHGEQKELEVFHKFTKPRTKITFHAEQITGITNEMVEHEKHASFYLKEMQSLVDRSDLVVVHGGKLDTSALTYAGVNLSGKEIFDTATMFKQLMPKETKSNLTYVCNLLEIKFEDAHSALSDVYATLELFENLTNLECDFWSELKNHRKLVNRGFTYVYN